MGGYAAFIWPAYGVAAVVLLGMLLASLRGLRSSERELAALEAARPERPRRRRARASDNAAGSTPAEPGTGETA